MTDRFEGLNVVHVKVAANDEGLAVLEAAKRHGSPIATEVKRATGTTESAPLWEVKLGFTPSGGSR